MPEVKDKNSFLFFSLTLSIILLWLILVVSIVIQAVYLPAGDAQRDISIVLNILSKNISGDFAYKNTPAYFPYLF